MIWIVEIIIRDGHIMWGIDPKLSILLSIDLCYNDEFMIVYNSGVLFHI